LSLSIRNLLVFSLLFGGAAHATIINLPGDGSVTVTDAVTQIGSLWQYDFTVADDSLAGLAVLDIEVTPGIGITSLTTPGPAGSFSTAYDSVLGLVSFLPNDSAFAATPTSGFAFDSTVAPAPDAFGVTLFDGAAQTSAKGAIQGPIAPEPSSIVLSALGLCAALVFQRRLTQASASR
jgi:hypothetical protein